MYRDSIHAQGSDRNDALKKVTIYNVVMRLCAVISLITVTTLAYAQTLDLDKVNHIKAAYIYPMAQLTTWPSDELSELDTLRVVFVGQETGELAAVLANKTSSLLVQGHRLEVPHIPGSLLLSDSQADFKDAIENAHTLYVGEEHSRHALRLCQQNQDRPLLIAGDGKNIPQDDGMVRFYVDEQRVRI
ncbi:MAG: hypothetical protein ACI9UQ_002457, partial [Candidatus Krumholzibacteriia bacterium]